MPTFDTPYRGLSISQAAREAAAIAPIDRVMLFAYEIWHPTFAAPFYFVNDRVDLVATIESSAARNPSTSQRFVACMLTMQRPEESDTAASPQISLGREGVSGILAAALSTARGSLVPWQLVERLYASDDLTGPAKSPVVTYYLTSATVSGASGSLTASYGDPANVSVPVKTFRREQYPSLDF